MLSRRRARRSWAEDDYYGAAFSMFRVLARRWRPVIPELHKPDRPPRRFPRHQPHVIKTGYRWSPWLLIK